MYFIVCHPLSFITHIQYVSYVTQKQLENWFYHSQA